MFELESQIRKWKTHLYAAGSIGHSDIEELESHLRDSMDELTGRGINIEEAFLLAVRRLGDVAVIHEEFAKLSTEDVWRQLLVPADNPLTARRNRKELTIVIGLAFLAGLLSKIPALFGYGDIEASMEIYARNATFFAFVPVSLYFIWKRSLPIGRSLLVLCSYIVLAVVVNVYPSYEPHHTLMLAALHLPIVVLFLLLYFYGGPSQAKEAALHAGELSTKAMTGWRSTNTRLNFVRFVGESFIYCILIGLGGIVLILLTGGTFELIEVDAFPFISSWMAPMGFFGLFTVAAYLVGQKKNLIESIAPVLAKIFTPLFLLVLLSLIAAFIITPNQAYENRDMLIWFDVILALVLALTLYSMSAKDYSENDSTVAVDGKPAVGKGHNPHLIWDILTLALIVSAVIVDAIALSGIIFRLSSSGFTPNKTAALGENLILLVNLILLTIGYSRYILGKKTFQRIVVMQMRFITVFAAWAAFVVVAFPLIFGFK